MRTTGTRRTMAKAGRYAKAEVEALRAPLLAFGDARGTVFSFRKTDDPEAPACR